MLTVEILPVQDTLVLRARGSELLILPHHVHKLKALSKPKEFSSYFHGEALVNRPARKLFEAWLRKDDSLWKRIYITIHKEMTLGEAPKDEDAAEAKPAKAEKTVVAKKTAEAAKETVAAKPKAEKKPEPKAEAKAEKDEKPKKAAAAPAPKKKDEKAEKKDEKKPAKPAAKKK